MINNFLKITVLGFLMCIGGMSTSHAQFEVASDANESIRVDSIPFVVALRKIVPVEYDFSFETKEDLGQMVSYEYGDNWENTLTSLLKKINLVYRIDNQVIYISTNVQQEVVTNMNEQEEPVGRVTEAKVNTSEETAAEAEETENVNYIWKVRRGFTLQEIIKSWGEKVGWSVIWNSDKDYDIQSEVSFTGSFVEASSELIEAFSEANPPVAGTFYKNNTLVIETISNGEVN